MRRGNASGSRGGFTLLELMIAITVMAIGLAAAFGGQISTHRVIEQSRDTQLALTQLEAVAEAVIAEVPGDLPTHENYGAGQAVQLATESGLMDLTIVCRYPNWAAGGEVPDPLMVDIEATWTDSERRPRTLTLSTAVSQ